ncbi:MAG TPA: hypothetical protein PLS90_02965 [Candidatus Sumerlaeota bacterium]|nr:MAG: hypothetical protein BWZ08_01165 [candidate division BRC1 bacterium ADurb.BinA292]HOE94984.1 hypothetical protein [Candidatus Sumerlaeota bacterium]HOR26848.1 hypothetical protein [Candidatus Sumerlaeota bacterium]HPK01397.1 hypothetical protein [Candidatus Sumerlaeota bacterium]
MNKTDPMPCCESLRGKSMYYRPDERPGRLHESDVMNYYCLHTQGPVGPDGVEARPRLCQPGRACHVKS